jgi:parB
VTTAKTRANTQLGPQTAKRTVKKATTRNATTTANPSVRLAFRQPSTRDYLKKMTIEVDRDVHTELKAIAARQGLTIRDIIGSYIEQYIKENR